MKKNILASLLALCMGIMLFPSTALATELSGTCGTAGNEKGVTWALMQNNSGEGSATYTFTISGTGTMADYVSSNAQGNHVPWAGYISQTTTEVTTNPDGSTVVTRTQSDGTVIITRTETNGVVTEVVDKPGENTAVTVTIPQGLGETTVLMRYIEFF